MIQASTTTDSTLAAIETALPIEPQSYTIGDRSTDQIIIEIMR